MFSPEYRVADSSAASWFMFVISEVHDALSWPGNYASGSWQTTSMLCPSGPMTKAA